MSEKRPLLLFSGGLDSTYMLHNALQETDVDTLYIDGGQGELKIQAEKLARNAIRRWLMVDMPIPSGKDRRYRIENELSFNSTSFAEAPDMVSKQAPSWLIAALYHFDHNVHSEVRIAYVLGDDALLHRHEMTNAWDNLCKLCKWDSAPLVFPLMQWRKENILQHLPVELVDLVWVCELPFWEGMTLTACGRCRACKRHHREMLDRFGSMKLFKARVKEAKAYTAKHRSDDVPAIEPPTQDDVKIDDTLIETVHGGNDSSMESQPQLTKGKEHEPSKPLGVSGKGTGARRSRLRQSVRNVL